MKRVLLCLFGSVCSVMGAVCGNLDECLVGGVQRSAGMNVMSD
jgi:hypothetical protein